MRKALAMNPAYEVAKTCLGVVQEAIRNKNKSTEAAQKNASVVNDTVTATVTGDYVIHGAATTVIAAAVTEAVEKPPAPAQPDCV